VGSAPWELPGAASRVAPAWQAGAYRVWQPDPAVVEPLDGRRVVRLADGHWGPGPKAPTPRGRSLGRVAGYEAIRARVAGEPPLAAAAPHPAASLPKVWMGTGPWVRRAPGPAWARRRPAAATAWRWAWPAGPAQTRPPAESVAATAAVAPVPVASPAEERRSPREPQERWPRAPPEQWVLPAWESRAVPARHPPADEPAGPRAVDESGPPGRCGMVPAWRVFPPMRQLPQPSRPPRPFQPEARGLPTLREPRLRGPRARGASRESPRGGLPVQEQSQEHPVRTAGAA